MGMPAVVGVGASASGQAAVTAAFPVGYTPVAGHVGVIFQECENADTPAVPSGWALITGQGVASGTTTKLTAFWIRFAGGETAPSVPDPGNHQTARMIVVSGCKTTGNPWNIFITATELVADTSVSINGVTTTAADCLILAAFATGQDANNTTNATGWANGALANVTERMDNWTALGLGGGFAMATGEKAAAGATGATTATVGTANNKALMTIALEGAGVTEHQASATLTATGTLAAGATRDAAAAATLAGTGTLTAVGALARTAPSYPAEQTLAEGTGTRQFAAVTTQAGDYLVVEAIGEDGGTLTALTPTATGLTFTQQTNAGASGDVRVQQWTAPDAAGGSRTVTITPNDGASRYRGHLTVVRGSDGPGTGKATSLTGQTVSVTRQDDNSGMHMAVGDWSAGAVGTPTWTPGGATRASQQGAGATYLIGRWDDSGAAGTASHGISSPSYTTPAVAVLEMLGTAAGGVTEHQASASLAGTGTLTAAAGREAAAAAALTGTATLIAAAAAQRPAAAALTGTGTLTAAAGRQATIVAALAGTGTLSATTVATRTASAALAGTGTLTAEATVGAAPVLIQAALTGTGTLTASALRAATTAATLTATGTLSAAAAATLTLTAQLAATGTLTAGLALTTSSGAALAATATLTAEATVAGAYQPAYWSIDSHTTAGTLDTHTSTGTLDTATTASGHLT